MNGSTDFTTGGTAVLGFVSASPRLTPLGTGMSPESAIVGALRQDKPRAGWHRPVVVPATDGAATDAFAAADAAAAFGIVAYGAEAEPQRILPHARLRNAHPAIVTRSRHRSRPR
ncbi:hypothetical protein IU449_11100 [Nocardia higoensis]|uniref:Uncharacterized protein n=1 Tax=Nocardia higoensis TaxID=228599 RepID=A0ABS0DB73_9NOCA|nr:hypothetical protein [Nocardia higoensis]MBF6355083.1 hypothetical protein [Nocardia higoensis]